MKNEHFIHDSIAVDAESSCNMVYENTNVDLEEQQPYEGDINLEQNIAYESTTIPLSSNIAYESHVHPGTGNQDDYDYII